MSQKRLLIVIVSFVVILVTAVVGTFVYVSQPSWLDGTIFDGNFNANRAGNVTVNQQEKTKQFSNRFLRLKFPQELSIASEAANSIHLTHQVDYEHTDPCTDEQKQKLTDFEVILGVFALDMTSTIERIVGEDSAIVEKYITDNKVDASAEKINETQFFGYDGYSFYVGEPGCGELHHYHKLGEEKTFFKIDPQVSLFSQATAEELEEYTQIEDIILPEDRPEIMNVIYEDLEFKDPTKSTN